MADYAVESLQPSIQRDLSFSNWCYDGLGCSGEQSNSHAGRSSIDSQATFSSANTDSEVRLEPQQSSPGWLDAIRASGQQVSYSLRGICRGISRGSWVPESALSERQPLIQHIESCVAFAQAQIGPDKPCEAGEWGPERSRRRWRLRSKRTQLLHAEQVRPPAYFNMFICKLCCGLEVDVATAHSKCS